jgi:hypothetical protein
MWVPAFSYEGLNKQEVGTSGLGSASNNVDVEVSRKLANNRVGMCWVPMRASGRLYACWIGGQRERFIGTLLMPA